MDLFNHGKEGLQELLRNKVQVDGSDGRNKVVVQLTGKQGGDLAIAARQVIQQVIDSDSVLKRWCTLQK